MEHVEMSRAKCLHVAKKKKKKKGASKIERELQPEA